MKIVLKPSCFMPEVIMEIDVPDGRDAEEYIDEYLEALLAEEFKYNVDWNFV